MPAWFGALGDEWYPLAPDLKLAVEADVMTTMASVAAGGPTSMKANQEDQEDSPLGLGLWGATGIPWPPISSWR